MCRLGRAAAFLRGASLVAPGPIAGSCSPPVRVPAWPQRLMHRSLAQSSSLRSWCNASSTVLPLLLLPRQRPALRWRAPCWGDTSDFHVGLLKLATAEARPLYFGLGCVSGMLAVAYNRALLATTTAAERLDKLRGHLRAGVIGAAVGVLAWFTPALVGGGDAITQRTLLGVETLTLVPLAFLLRFGLGAISYAAGTPGGLFAPLLVLGAQSGLLFGAACRLSLPNLNLQPEGFAVAGMAALFAGVVRAPITGIVLVTEITDSVTMLLPMLGACFTAMLVPTLMREEPIYEALRKHMLRGNRVR